MLCIQHMHTHTHTHTHTTLPPVAGKGNYSVTTTVTIFKSECSNFVYSDCAPVSEVGSLTYVSTFTSFKFVRVIRHDQKHEFYLLVVSDVMMM